MRQIHVAILERAAENAYQNRDMLLANALYNEVGKVSAEESEFDKAMKGKTFRNPESGNKVQFHSLPSKEQSKIRKQWSKKTKKPQKPQTSSKSLDLHPGMKEVADWFKTTVSEFDPAKDIHEEINDKELSSLLKQTNSSQAWKTYSSMIGDTYPAAGLLSEHDVPGMDWDSVSDSDAEAFLWKHQIKPVLQKIQQHRKQTGAVDGKKPLSPAAKQYGETQETLSEIQNHLMKKHNLKDLAEINSGGKHRDEYKKLVHKKIPDYKFLDRK